MSDSTDDPQPGPSGLQSDDDSERGRRRRRKVADRSAWRSVIAQKKRNRGEEYVSVRTGKKVQARKIGPPCTCENKCYEKVPEGVRNVIHSNFWATGSYNDQNGYLAKLMKSKTVKRRRKPVEQAEKFRRHTIEYRVIHNTVL